ncbi:MAG: AI-2E family transporter [Pseudomonadota bacterium]
MDHPASKVTAVCLCIIAAFTTIAALKFAQDLLAPVVMALVLGVVLSPLARRLEDLGIPRAFSAGSSLVFAGVALGMIVVLFGPVLSNLLDQIPKIEQQFRGWFSEITRGLRSLGGLSFELERTLSESGEDAVENAVPGILDALWLAPNLLAQILIFSGTLFFFILTRDEIYCFFPQQRRALQTADRAVSFYFTTVTMINMALGLALCAALTVIGLPNPVLWGAAAFLFNFAVYLGPITLVVALAIAGMMTFNSAYALLPPLAFLVLNAVESQFVTPALVGKRLNVNPLAVFLSIIFGLWLWGPLGGIVSLPVLVWVYSAVAAQSKRGHVTAYVSDRVA